MLRLRYLALLAPAAALIAGLVLISQGGARAADGGGFRALSGDEARGFILPADMRLATSFPMDPYGLTYERYQQKFGAANVLGGQITLYRDDSGAVLAVIGSHFPDISPTNAVGLSQADARRVAQRDVGPAEQSAVDLMIDPGSGRFFFRVESRSLDSRWVHWIDAASGAVLNKYSAIETDHGTGVKGDTKSMAGLTTLHGGGRPSSRGYWLQSSDGRQLTYDDGNNGGNAYIMIDSDDHWTLAGRHSPGQPAGVDAQYYSNVTDDYYQSVHGRNSFDNNGAAMRNIVHALTADYNNAYWNGSLVVFGDGNGTSFREFSGGLDVVGHEWTHAVTDYTSALIYQNQSGALNESFSDMMGNSIEFFANEQPATGNCVRASGQTACADWWVGEDIDTRSPGDVVPGFRNMASPAEDGDPDDYSEYLATTGDNGGVHTNSGIPNHAYFLLASGGQNAGCALGHSHCSGDGAINVTGIGVNDAQRIFYLGFTGLPSGASFCNARAATEATAAALFGAASQQAQSTTDAWLAVGLTDAVCGTSPSPTSTPTPEPTPSPIPGVSVTGIDPDTIAAGTSVAVTITGSGFASGAAVTFENSAGPAPQASSVVAVSAGEINATIDVKSGGPRGNRVWDVRVTNPDGSTGVLAGGFTVTR